MLQARCGGLVYTWHAGARASGPGDGGTVLRGPGVKCEEACQKQGQGSDEPPCAMLFETSL